MKIKRRIEKELAKYSVALKKQRSLIRISPLLFKYIGEFILREGKRLRPTLFVLGYLGFAKKPATGFYTSAISIELLHDFMLVHDDIIDKSSTRRGKPSMHAMLNAYLKRFKGIKFSGEDLTIVAGDVMFAMAIEAFLSIKEKEERKEKALRQLIRAALYTGAGEFIELIDGARDISKITRQDIYKIYDYKTAYYTFSSPLVIGAILGGAGPAETKKLIRYGIFLGRAFQIKDDILGIFGDEKKIGKSVFTDLQEAKKTLLIWYAFGNSSPKNRLTIRKTLTKKKTDKTDLCKMRKIIAESKALDYAKKEIEKAAKASDVIIRSSGMKQKYKILLKNFSEKILRL